MGKLVLRSTQTLCDIVRGSRRLALQPLPQNGSLLLHTARAVMQQPLSYPDFGTCFYSFYGTNDQNSWFRYQSSRAFYERFYSLSKDENNNDKMANVNESKLDDNKKDPSQNVDSGNVSAEITETSGSKRRFSEGVSEQTSDDIREVNPDGTSPPKKPKKHKKHKHSKSWKRKEVVSTDNRNIICLDESDCVAIEKTSPEKNRKKANKKHKKHKNKRHHRAVVALGMEDVDTEGLEPGEIICLEDSRSTESKVGKVKSDDKRSQKKVSQSSKDSSSNRIETKQTAKNKDRRNSQRDRKKRDRRISAPEDSTVDLIAGSPKLHQTEKSPSRISSQNTKATQKSDKKSKKNFPPVNTKLDTPSDIMDMDIDSSPTVGGIYYVGELEQEWQGNANDPVTPSVSNVHYASDLEQQWQMDNQGFYSEYNQQTTQNSFQTAGAQSSHLHWQHQSAWGTIPHALSPNVQSSLNNWRMQGRTPDRGFHTTGNRWQQEWESTSSPDLSEGVTIDMSKPYSGSNDWLRRREWEFTDYGKQKRSGERKEKTFDFSIASYNVLAQNLIRDNYTLYDKCHSRYLDWEYRSQNLIHEISELGPDIICMQEVNDEHYVEFFAPQLKKLGYDGKFKKRAGDKRDGCATFWKESKFNLEKSAPVDYYKPGVSVLDRDNVALLVLLKPKGKKMNNQASKLCVANTHLLFNPRRGDVKLAQAMVLMAEIEKLAFMRHLPMNGKEKYSPTLLCGDFNCVPFCDLYKFFGRGILHYDGLLQRTMSGQEEGYHGNDWCMNRQVIPKHLGITDKCQYLEEVKDRWMKFIDTLKKKTQETSAAQSQANNVANKTIDLTEETARENQVEKQEEIIEITKDNTSEELTLKHGQSDNSVDKSHKERSSLSPGKSPQRHDNNSGENPSRALEEPSLAQCTGVLSHKANFVSVYSHEYQNGHQYEREATTHHGRANCTVDYIFYSVEHRRTRTHKHKFKYHSVNEGRLRLMAKLTLASERKLSAAGCLPNKAVSSDHTILMAKFALNTSSK